MKMKWTVFTSLIVCSSLLGGCSSMAPKREISSAGKDKLALESSERTPLLQMQKIQAEFLKSIVKKLEKTNLKSASSLCRLDPKSRQDTVGKLRANYTKLEASMEYWLALGNCAYLLNDDPLKADKAYYFYRLALGKAKDKSEEAKVLNNLGVLLWHKGNVSLAIQHFEQAKNQGNFLSPHFNQLSLTLSEGQLFKSVELLEKLPKEIQGDLELDMMRAYIKIALGEYGEGIKIINSHSKELTSAESNFPLAFFLKSFALFQMGKALEAKEALESGSKSLARSKNPELLGLVKELSESIESELENNMESKVVQTSNLR